MIKFLGRGILLDIEGTTSSVSFVYDVMFPAVRAQLNDFLQANWTHAETQAACDAIAQDAGYADVAAWGQSVHALSTAELQAIVRDQVIRLMDDDVKATGLKQLQGLIWRHGFESGALQAHVYDDVPAALQRWKQAGADIRIYSSGSIQAQRLFFGHTVVGDLLPNFQGHYDTTIGSKRDAASYQAIAKEFAVTPQSLLFVSDICEELDAAAQAAMQTALSVRPGNAPVTAQHGHREVRSFAEIEFVRAGSEQQTV